MRELLTTAKRFSLLATAFAFVHFSPLCHAQGQLYSRSSDAPRTSKTPKSIGLQLSSGSSESGIKVRAALAEIRLDHSSSRGGAGMTGRLNKFRKFVRLDLRGVTPIAKLSSIQVDYLVKEGASLIPQQDIVKISKPPRNFIVDTEGFEDVSGTEVKTSSSITTTTSTKYKHFKAEVTYVGVTLLDSAGEKLYSAAWPKKPTDLVVLPPRLKPRTFTAKDGRTVKGTISKLEADSVHLFINGKEFGINFANLSEADQTYLRNLGNPGGTPKSSSNKPREPSLASTTTSTSPVSSPESGHTVRTSPNLKNTKWSWGRKGDKFRYFHENQKMSVSWIPGSPHEDYEIVGDHSIKWNFKFGKTTHETTITFDPSFTSFTGRSSLSGQVQGKLIGPIDQG